MSSTANSVDFNDRLNLCETVSDCGALFREAILPYGFDTFACGELDLSHRDRKVFFLVDWPPDWFDFYIGRRVYERDPIVDALAYRTQPFTFTELREDRKLSKLGSETLQVIAAHGWQEGFVVPMPRGGTQVGS